MVVIETPGVIVSLLGNVTVSTVMLDRLVELNVFGRAVSFTYTPLVDSLKCSLVSMSILGLLERTLALVVAIATSDVATADWLLLRTAIVVSLNGLLVNSSTSGLLAGTF